MLVLKNVEVVYDDVILVLKGLSLEVPNGKIVALLGSNGAGKPTTLKAISGLLHAEEGEVTDGAIELEGERIDELGPEQIVRRGVFQVMEGRRVFEDLTVDENIVMGGYTRSDRAGLKRDHDLCFDYFPPLKRHRSKLAGYLSGGEQQMLAISRALLTNPRLLIMDEPSEGLAPTIVEGLIQTIKDLAAAGMGLLVVEQNLGVATSLADRQLVMVAGSIATETTAHELLGDPAAQRRYLGVEPLADAA